MKFFIFLITLFLITGCNNKESNEHSEQNKTVKTKAKTNSIKTIQIKDINITIKEGRLTFPNKKIVFLFKDNTSYSKEQEEVLKKLNIKYYITNNEILKKHFHISIYPTIIIVDHNKTVKYENFTPYEFLKEAF